MIAQIHVESHIKFKKCFFLGRPNIYTTVGQKTMTFLYFLITLSKVAILVKNNSYNNFLGIDQYLPPAQPPFMFTCIFNGQNHSSWPFGPTAQDIHQITFSLFLLSS